MCNPVWRRLFAGACATLLASLACAQQSLSLRETVERSLANSPELKSFGFELRMQEARIEQAGARPALELGVTVEDVAGSGTYEGVDSAETTLTVGWVWERGARGHRVQAAQAGLDALQSEAQLKRLDIAAEAARRFLSLLTHQQELEELQRSLALAEETHAAVQARVSVGKAPEAEAARSYAQLARARLDLEHEEHEMLTASVRLAAMWGEKPSDSDRAAVVVRGDLQTLPAFSEFGVLSARLQNNPNLSRLLSTERLREAELSLASAQRPAWQFRAGARRFESSDDAALVLGLTLPLANRRQYQGAVSAARAHVEQTRVQGEALGVQLNAELFAMYQEMKHAITEATALREEVLPRMNAALEQARFAYERGRYSYMEWLATQREVTDVRRALIEAAANAHRYRIEIERLTGVSVYE
jgi:cobalt-zinc-cadmium efflux system outer membrane protein